MEVLVVDGGSQDSTRQIASRWGARVLHNPYGLAEPGFAVGVKAASGEFVISMAADNRMKGPHFIDVMLDSFNQYPGLVVGFPRVVSPQGASLADRYLNRFSDPFSHFVYGRMSSLPSALPMRAREPHFLHLIETDVRRHPLLGMVQGCTILRRHLLGYDPTNADDVVALLELIRQGHRLAFVPGAEMEHTSVGNLPGLYNKYRKRTSMSLSLRSHQGFLRRRPYLSAGRLARALLWPLYSATFALPCVFGIYQAIRWRELIALYHPVVNSVVLGAVARESVTFRAVRPIEDREGGLGSRH